MNDNFEAMLSSETVKLLFEQVKANLALEEIIFNVRVLAHYMLGERSTLEFSLKPVQVKPVFETEAVKKAVLTKSAKALGMNKSTHWYQRQRLRDRGNLRLYRNTRQYYVD